MNKGYVALHRSIEDSTIWDASPCAQLVFIRLLLKARHTRGEHSGTIINEGQLVWSMKDIEKELKWFTYKQIRGAFDFLRKKGSITTEQRTHKQIITVCNWHKYQSNDNEAGRTEGTKRATIRATTKEAENSHHKGFYKTQQSTEGNTKGTERATQGQPINKNVNNEIINTDSVYGAGEREGFQSFKNWIATNAPSVAQMKEPFTIEQYLSLKQKFHWTKVCDILTAMDLWEPLLTKRKNAYKTFLTFERRNHTDNNNKKQHHGI